MLFRSGLEYVDIFYHHCMTPDTPLKETALCLADLVRRGKEEFEQPEYQQLLKDLGVEGEWEGIGHCAVGYVNGDIPAPAPRKDGRVFWVE